jgi:hypothetical protein
VIDISHTKLEYDAFIAIYLQILTILQGIGFLLYHIKIIFKINLRINFSKLLKKYYKRFLCSTSNPIPKSKLWLHQRFDQQEIVHKMTMFFLQGDSGSPLMLQTQKGTFIVGITHLGISCSSLSSGPDPLNYRRKPGVNFINILCSPFTPIVLCLKITKPKPN